MNKEEKINTLKNMLNCYLHSTNLTNKEMKESEKFTDELIEDICNTRCCEELPIKKEIDFDGNLLAEIETTDKNLKVLRCIDGRGNIINVAKVQIDEVVR